MYQTPKTLEPKQAWIDAGYASFAQGGLSSLKVDTLSKAVGKSRSSFYHHFFDIDWYISGLLDFHVQRSVLIAHRESECTAVIPDLLEVILHFKQDLLFNRQLRVYRDKEPFKDCLAQTEQITAGAITGIWAETMGLSEQTALAEMVLALTIENFYLQITEETLNYEWLKSYVLQLQGMVQAFKAAH